MERFCSYIKETGQEREVFGLDHFLRFYKIERSQPLNTEYVSSHGAIKVSKKDQVIVANLPSLQYIILPGYHEAVCSASA